MTDQPLRDGEATRRAALAGAGLAGVAVLAGCSSASSSSPAASGGSSSAAATGTSSGASGTSSGAAGGSGSGTALGSASGITVGGGKVFTAAKVVVTQPSAGEYKGFSAVCTHMQCIVDQVAGGTIDCPCHGSKFSIKDGSVVSGPAPSPLPSAPVTVSDGQVMLG
ncbi:MAG TPA: Rieske (2Fe-2S) protein [Trebonia sp.]|nr:Rieske (2Fe-2S) protein [Trebonia sp.]